MAGTKEGGAKTALTNKSKYGEDYYSRIGAKGARAGKGKEYQKGGSKAKGWAVNPKLAAAAGSIGGKISKKRSRDEKVSNTSA